MARSNQRTASAWSCGAGRRAPQRTWGSRRRSDRAVRRSAGAWQPRLLLGEPDTQVVVRLDEHAARVGVDGSAVASVRNGPFEVEDRLLQLALLPQSRRPPYPELDGARLQLRRVARQQKTGHTRVVVVVGGCKRIGAATIPSREGRLCLHCVRQVGRGVLGLPQQHQLGRLLGVDRGAVCHRLQQFLRRAFCVHAQRGMRGEREVGEGARGQCSRRVAAPCWPRAAAPAPEHHRPRCAPPEAPCAADAALRAGSARVEVLQRLGILLEAAIRECAVQQESRVVRAERDRLAEQRERLREGALVEHGDRAQVEHTRERVRPARCLLRLVDLHGCVLLVGEF
eukprot:5679521-Prymnesium_polylepis.1